MLVLIGPDGSGKTTVAGYLAAYLNSLFSQVRYFHGHFQILPRLRDLAPATAFKLREPASLPKSISSAEGQNNVKFNLWKSLFYISYYTLDSLLGHFFVFVARGRGELLIFDRYYYDYLIWPLITPLPGMLFWVKKLIPQPDLVIYLKNTPDLIIPRKPELSRGELVRQGLACEKLIEQLAHGQVVETSQIPEETAIHISKLLISKLTARTAGKLDS
jgi:thymidylate kinase